MNIIEILHDEFFVDSVDETMLIDRNCKVIAYSFIITNAYFEYFEMYTP